MILSQNHAIKLDVKLLINKIILLMKFAIVNGYIYTLLTINYELYSINSISLLLLLYLYDAFMLFLLYNQCMQYCHFSALYDINSDIDTNTNSNYDNNDNKNDNKNDIHGDNYNNCQQSPTGLAHIV